MLNFLKKLVDEYKTSNFLKKFIHKLKKNKSRVSLFIEPDLSVVKKANLLNADCIEIHTGRFCNLVNENRNYKMFRR